MQEDCALKTVEMVVLEGGNIGDFFVLCEDGVEE